MDFDANLDPDNDVCDDGDFARMIDQWGYDMDAVDYDPDVLAREARGPQQVRQPPPESEALQQMLSEALNREMTLRAEIIRLRRSMPA
jgi:hypothetical protein